MGSDAMNCITPLDAFLYIELSWLWMDAFRLRPLLKAVAGEVHLGVSRVAEVALGGGVVGVALEVAGRDGAGGFCEGDGLPAGVDSGGEEMEGGGGVAAGEETGDEAGYSKGGYFYESADETAGFVGGHRELQEEELDTEAKCLQRDPESEAIRRRLTLKVRRDNDPNGAGVEAEIGGWGAFGEDSRISVDGWCIR
jgi:hypothetical protein